MTRASFSLQRGLSLTELMVSLTVGLVISAAAIEIFINSRSTYQAETGLARIQENGRFAIDFLNRELRHAGNMGCLQDYSKKLSNLLNPPGGPANDWDRPVEGYEAANTGPGTTIDTSYAGTTWSPALPATRFPGGALPGTDALLVRYLDNRRARLVPPAFLSDAQLFADSPAGLQDGDIALITNCKRATLFQVTNVQDDTGGDPPKFNIVHSGDASIVPGNICASWGSPACPGEQPYGADAELARMVVRAFYIRRNAAGVPALYQATLTGSNAGASMQAEELIDGIENMQILYGIDRDGGKYADGEADAFLTATQVEALPSNRGWPRVVSVRISLLVRSTMGGEAMETTTDTSSYLLAGALPAHGVSIIPTQDRQRRRVFTTTIQLRSRGV